MLCVFDCESILDFDALRECFGYEGSDEEVAKEAMRNHEEKTNSTFLPLPFHKLIAISAVIGDEYGAFQKVSSLKANNEEELIKSFLQFIDSKNPRLISYNGRCYDIPLIMLRALKYNFSCPSYFESNNTRLNKNKWENYRVRYSDRFHLDLMDQISEFGAARGLKLDEICKCIDIPGKYDVSGDQVLNLYFEDKIDKINEYCESDVLNTYWLFLKFELLRGNINKDDYLNNLILMKDNLKEDKSYHEVFTKYILQELKKEEKKCNT